MQIQLKDQRHQMIVKGRKYHLIPWISWIRVEVHALHKFISPFLLEYLISILALS